MICGRFKHNLDEKKRIKIPSELREELGAKVYLIEAPDVSTKCIYIYSEAGWTELYQQFAQGEEYTEETRRLTRRILSSVVCGNVDKNGRLTLDSELKSYAGINDEVYIIGNFTHVELWAAEEWSREKNAMAAQSTKGHNIKF